MVESRDDRKRQKEQQATAAHVPDNNKTNKNFADLCGKAARKSFSIQ